MDFFVFPYSASDYQTNSTGKLRRPAPYAAAIQTKETGLDYETERDSLSPWSVPDDIQRLLHDNYDSLFEVRSLIIIGMSWGLSCTQRTGISYAFSYLFCN